MKYVSLHKKQLLDSLETQVLFGDLCSVIIGEQGIGKTYFIEQLNLRLSEKVSFSLIDSQSEMSISQLEKSISLQLGLSWEQNDNLIEKVKQRFEQKALIVVDNAELLPINCLDYLLGLVNEQREQGSTHVYIILAGVKALAEKINQTATLIANQDICVVFEMQPIELSETQFLVAEFQELDLETTKALYDNQKLESFWNLSQGNPKNLNYQLQRWIAESDVKLNQESSNLSQPHGLSWRKILLGVGYSLIAVVLIFILIYQDEINQKIEGENKSEIVALNKKTNNPMEEKSIEPKNIKQIDIKKQDRKTESSIVKVENELVNKQINDSKKSEPTKKTVIKEVDKQESSQPKITETTKQNTAKETENNVAAESKKFKPKEIKTKQDVSSNETNTLDIQSIANEIETELATNKVQNEKSRLTDDEKRIMAFSDTSYTLQWVVVSNLQAAKSFINQHRLQAQLMIFRRKSEKGTLYFVISGEYASKQAAELAVAKHRQQNYKEKVWIKSLTAVQKDILSL